MSLSDVMQAYNAQSAAYVDKSSDDLGVRRKILPSVRVISIIVSTRGRRRSRSRMSVAKRSTAVATEMTLLFSSIAVFRPARMSLVVLLRAQIGRDIHLPLQSDRSN